MKGLYDHPRANDAGIHVCLPLGGTLLLAVLIVLAALAFSCGPNDAEKRTLDIHGAVHVYPTVTPPAEYPGSDFIDVVGPKDHVKVIQVVHKRSYMAVRIRLSNGREGWVFSGESIELR
jgi:hypothetical protein